MTFKGETQGHTRVRTSIGFFEKANSMSQIFYMISQLHIHIAVESFVDVFPLQNYPEKNKVQYLATVNPESKRQRQNQSQSQNR